MITIIGALEEEISGLRAVMELKGVLTRASRQFFHGAIAGHEVVVVRSGVGKVNAAVCTQILVDAYHPDCIINTGIAGALSDQLRIGDIVLSTDAVHHDVDTSAFGDPPGLIPGMEGISFPADADLRKLAKKVCQEVNPEIAVWEGRVLSADRFVSDREARHQIAEQFQGMCTEMEGAAIAQTAFLNDVPYLVIRAISDEANAKAVVEYETFKTQAIASTVRLVHGIVAHFGKEKAKAEQTE